MYVAVLDTKNGGRIVCSLMWERDFVQEWNGQTNNKMCFWCYLVFFLKIYLSIYLSKQYVFVSFAEYLVKKMPPWSIHLADDNNQKIQRQKYEPKRSQYLISYETNLWS